MRIQTIIIFFCAVLCSMSTSAQQSYSSHTQYLYNPYMFNPARAGFGEGLPNLFLDYRRQWVEMPNSPDTKILTADAKLSRLKDERKKKRDFHDEVGIGGIFYQDNTFLINRFGGLLSYAYHFLPPPAVENSNHKHQFSIGLSTGFIYQGIDYTQVRAQDMDDEILFTDDVSQTAFDLGFGMAYRYTNNNPKKSFQTIDVDLSVPHAPNSNILYFDNDGNSQNYQLLTHFLGSVNMEFKVPRLDKSNFYMKPGLMVKGTKGNPLQFDLSLITRYDNIVWFGGGMKWGAQQNESPLLGYFTSIGVQVMKSASIYYNFETRNNFNNALGVSHEVAIGYTFGRKHKQRFDEIETIAMTNERNVAANKNAITKNENRITENDRDIDAIILSEFKEDYRNHRQNGLYRHISQEKILERITKPIDFTGLSNVKTENIQKALEDENVYQSKVEDGLPERIYVIAHYFSQDADLTEVDMTAIRSRVEEALINIGFSADIIHSFTISEQDKDLKNHISILGRYPKK